MMRKLYMTQRAMGCVGFLRVMGRDVTRDVRLAGVCGWALMFGGGGAQAQFSVLHVFSGGADGSSPQYGALAVSEGRLFGTTGAGGSGNGVVFSLNADGSDFSVLHTFTGTNPDGAKPYGSVSLSGTTLYGTTYGGGSGNGTVFKVGTDGSGYQTLYSFATSAAYKPYSTVTPCGSMLYGTTYYSSGGVGAVYAVDTNGNGYATLHTFVGGTSDGKTPMGGALAVDGDLIYGTALHGGRASSGSDGVVFALATNGVYANVFAFSGGTTNGANPYGSVALSGSKLYGTTRLGGESANAGTVYSVNTDGTGFSTLYTFSGGTTNAANPYCTPVVDGNVLYGTTRLGGTNNLGTVFKINTDGSGFEILHHFSSEEGSEPSGSLTLSNQILYGFTLKGGSNNVGTVFALTVGEPGYAFEGTGMTNVLSGTVADGAVALSSVPTWIDNTMPSLPYTNETGVAVPPCDRIVSSRLFMTVWGGTADYACEMTVSVNGTDLPFAAPFVFGTTAYSNSLYSTESPRAYGSGYGVWFVSVPVPSELLHTDGTTNAIRVIENDAANEFDGRIQHVTLVTVYQSAALANVFDYSIAEGEGLLYSYPTAPKVDKRTIALDAVGTNDVLSAGLTALYTYGNTGQYDKLFFNGTQFGGDDVAQGDNTWGGTYGPSVVSFDVTGALAVDNEVTFDVCSSDVLDPPEGSLRPELAVLGVSREAPLAIRSASQMSSVSGFSFQWPGYSDRTYTVEYSTDLSDANGWTVLPGYSNVSGTNGLMTCVDSSGAAARFYRIIRQ